MKIGFIGTDEWQELIKRFLTAQTFLPTEIIIHDQNRQKTDSIMTQYPGIFAARHRRELVQEVPCFFAYINDDEYPLALEEIQSVTKSSQVAIFHSDSPVLTDLEKKLPCKIAKLIPQKSSLSTHQYAYITGSRMNELEMRWLEQLLATIEQTSIH